MFDEGFEDVEFRPFPKFTFWRAIIARRKDVQRVTRTVKSRLSRAYSEIGNKMMMTDDDSIIMILILVPEDKRNHPW
jgi:hypothetical protein